MPLCPSQVQVHVNLTWWWCVLVILGVVVLEESPCPRGPIYKSLYSSLELKSLSLSLSLSLKSLTTTPLRSLHELSVSFSPPFSSRATVLPKTSCHAKYCRAPSQTVHWIWHCYLFDELFGLIKVAEYVFEFIVLFCLLTELSFAGKDGPWRLFLGELSVAKYCIIGCAVP